MLGIDDIFIGFIISYLAGSFPSLKELFSKKDNKSLQDHVDRGYEQAVEKWCADDSVRKRVVHQDFADVNQLQALYGTPSWDENAAIIGDLINQWAAELHEDEECAHYIQLQEIKAVKEEIEKLAQILTERDNVRPNLERGRISHKPVDGYIRRYCTSEQNESNFFLYALGKKERHTLADYVVGLEGINANKFILYSSAQTGKTTELQQLCWELQQSGLFLPVSFEIRRNTNLKRDYLPSNQYSGRKEIVVVIDALDEVNGQKYEDILEEISGYAYDHPEIKMALSCRSNYRREKQLDLFQELFLEELSGGDAQEHIEKRLGKSKGRRLMKLVKEHQLNDFACNPFFLNVLIDAFQEDEQKVPRTKAEIYQLFIERSYNMEKEDKNIPSVVYHTFDEAVLLLERVALGMSLMNAQSLSEQELCQCLYNDAGNLKECLRFDLLRKEDGDRYSFKHNAFREWLVAHYLSREGLAKAKELATHPNGRIKPEWYNIIMLWVSMYGKDKEEEVQGISEWLKDASLDLIIYIDRKMLDKETRNQVFKGLLQEYKSLGIRMSNLMSQDYKNLLAFGQSEDTIRFLAEEIEAAEIGTAYYADLMCLCLFLDWESLERENKELTEQLFQALIKRTKEALVKNNLYDLSFLYFENRFFTREEYLERIFAVVKDSTHCEAIRSMIELIDLADKVDEYVDYILDKEGFVHNQQKGNTTHIVSRTCIFTAVQKVKSLEGVKKVLAHQFYGIRSSYRGEQEDYVLMMGSILRRASGYIKGGDTELVELLEKYYSRLYKDYHYHIDRDKQSQELLQALRDCYRNAGLIERGKKAFYEKLPELFEPHEPGDITRDTIRQTYSMAALWMTVEDVQSDFSHFSSSDNTDLAKASWYREIPYAEVANCATAFFDAKYPLSSSLSKGRERRQKSFRDFADYAVFKQLVLEMVSGLDEHTTRRDYSARLRSLEEGYNQYAFRFFLLYPDGEDKYDIDGIIKGIKDKDVYDTFFMKEVMTLIESNNPDLTISDEVRERCEATGREIVLKLADGDKAVCFGKEALEQMLKGAFEIPIEKLPGLLDYGIVHTSKHFEDNFFQNEYSVFDYITERVDEETLAPLIIKKLRACVDKENNGLSFHFSKFLVDNGIKEGYDLAMRFALSGFYMSGNMLDMLIKKGIRIEEIKTASASLALSDRYTCYLLLAKCPGQEGWVKEKLEAEFKSYEGFYLKRAIQLLVSLGSMEALGYLHSHPELLDDGDGFHFAYDSLNAVPSLCFFIGYYYDNRLDGHFMLNSILKSLERIAVKGQEELKEVKGYLRQLTKRGEPFKYLNRHIIAFEDKYYSMYSGISDIQKAMDLVDGVKIGSGEITDNPDLKEGDGIYISYNWEGASAHIVDYLCFVLENKGIPFKRDRKDCLYQDNIKEFMDAIRSGKKVIVVLSRPYLKSRNCMYELSGILADPSYKDRILPVVVDDTIREDIFYVELVKYWKEQKEKAEQVVNELRALDPEMAEPEEKKLKEINDIYSLLKVIKDYIDWTNADNLDSLSATRFKTIIDKICSGN